MGLFGNISLLDKLVELLEKLAGVGNIRELIDKAIVALDKYVKEEGVQGHNVDDGAGDIVAYETPVAGDNGDDLVVELPEKPVAETPVAPEKPVAEKTDDLDAVPFSALQWCYGGFNGAKAGKKDNCVIGNLKVGKNITYKWIKGGCETLGATDKGDASHTICALFCLDSSGKWKGGKFDWISTSRTSRDLKNIETGYNGWSSDVFKNARRYVFVIVSSNGKARSNVIGA